MTTRRALAFALLALLLAGGTAGAATGQALDAATVLAASQAAIGRPVGAYAFTDSGHRRVELADFRGRPLVLTMVYTGCADVCPTLSASLVDAAREARGLFGRDAFTVAVVGFDARRDTPERLRAFARSRGLPLNDWVFLSGSADSIDGLAADIGFSFVPAPQGFDHAAQTTVLDAEGRVYRQIYGAIFEPPALIEPLKELIWGRPAGANLAAALIDRIRLICTVYDPASGRYRFSYAIFIGSGLSAATLLGMAVILVRSWRRWRRHHTPCLPVAKTTLRTRWFS